MRHGELAFVIALLVSTGHTRAQNNSLDALEQELKEAKQQHQDVSDKALSNFFAQVDPAMGDPSAAITLYQKAGGILPDPTPVVTQHENESASEKDARLAQDQANQAALGTVLQLHCGLLHFGALRIMKPDQKSVQDDWAAWLQKAAATYAQLSPPAPSSAQPSLEPRHKRHEGAPAHGFNPGDLMGKNLRDSPITRYLGFQKFAAKEEGEWSVRSLPSFYKATILDPSRAQPTASTLGYWDVYIAMMSADEKDPDRWDQIVYPPLQFDRACDDYAVNPSTEKLEALVNLIKADPTFPQVDDWITRTKKLMEDYRASRGSKSAMAANLTPAPPTNPNVVVTTEKQGDATIITTHTNAPPKNPAP